MQVVTRVPTAGPHPGQRCVNVGASGSLPRPVGLAHTTRSLRPLAPVSRSHFCGPFALRDVVYLCRPRQTLFRIPSKTSPESLSLTTQALAGTQETVLQNNQQVGLPVGSRGLAPCTFLTLQAFLHTLRVLRCAFVLPVSQMCLCLNWSTVL